MRTVININENWSFIKENVGLENIANINGENINIPHTWNGKDGQDGGNNYYRGLCFYVHKMKKPTLSKNGKAYLEFKGVNSTATIWVNNQQVAYHEGGYSAFRADITDVLQEENTIVVCADNVKNNTVYPQTADFTFYGGIYRDVNLICVDENHYDLNYYGACGLQVVPTVDLDNNQGTVIATAYTKSTGTTKISILDADNKVVATGTDNEPITIDTVRLWNGLADPYLYKVKAELFVNDEKTDEVVSTFGFRQYYVDPQKGFFLNGKSYPLRGVCRHQDRPLIGNALTKKEHDEDLAIMLEMGSNTIRLAHYQHDDYFYDICDETGIVVWSEIPYISKQLSNGNSNAVEQMKELIYQTFNHASIVCRCVSNEITMFPAGKQRAECHQEINDLCKKIDPERFTVLACYMIVSIGNKLSRVTDVVSYNLYYGWYWPCVKWTGSKLDRFHKRYPNNPIGLSEYGADAMPNLHSIKPKRGDNTEEYQLYYHENVLRIINERDYLWGTHLWNMFDFAADARNQGGDAGMNHKGMVTFDRKTRKDAFYLYKAFWSSEEFIHLCGKRFINRTGNTLEVKVYSNKSKVSLYNNGKLIEEKSADRIFNFSIPMEAKNDIVVKSGDLSDSGLVLKVEKKDPAYVIKKTKTKSWQ